MTLVLICAAGLVALLLLFIYYSFFKKEDYSVAARGEREWAIHYQRRCALNARQESQREMYEIIRLLREFEQRKIQERYFKQCSSCLLFEGQDEINVTIKKCNHVFHSICFYQHILSNYARKQCPTCKAHIEFEDLIIKSVFEKRAEKIKKFLVTIWKQDIHKLRRKESCAICLDGLIKSDCSRITKCGHMFHGKCIWKSLTRLNKCPMCMEIITFNDIKDLDLNSPSTS